MRFNDLMQTVLAAEHRNGLGAVTLWRQCVDLLAQQDRPNGSGIDDEQRALLVARLATLRSDVTETQRIATVVELGHRLRSPTLVTFFAGDRPAIAAAAMARAQLPDDVWPALVPDLTPTARGVLRGRADIGPEARRALAAFGSVDLVLTTERRDMVGEADMLLTPDMASPAIVPLQEAEERAIYPEDAREPHPIGLLDSAAGADRPEGDGQIRNLVDRIERFTSGRRPNEAVPPPPPVERAPTGALRSFAFETDAIGIFTWVDQGPRAALIGLSLGETALTGGSGPDGHVAGAFARRSGFRNGRFTVVGGALSGEWRLSASPYFDPHSGRFQGYRGQARRPYLHEVAAQPEPAPVAIAGLSSDSLRQLVHELRTPLNAILGFAEIIEQELFGAAGPTYRDIAGKIAVDARHLLSAFDDLDLAARVSRGEPQGQAQSLDPALLVMQVAARYREQAGAAAMPVDIAMAHALPHVRIDPVQGERMVQHLFRTVVSVAPAGEGLTGSCWFQPDGDGRVVLALDRPSTLAGMEEAQLLDPGFTPDGEWADGPLLSLGFSLRLIRSLAVGCGGNLTIEPGRLLLSMPADRASEGAADIGQG